MPSAPKRLGKSGKKQIMIYSHGFKGFSDWGFIPYVCQEHAARGIISVAIDFSMNGIIDRKEMLYDAEVFAANTVSIMLDELHGLVEHIKTTDWYEKIAGEVEFCLSGHSLGAAISLVTAAERKDIKNLVLWGSVGTLNRNTARQKELWKEKGRIEFQVRPGGQRIYQNYSYLEDKERNADRIDLKKRAGEYDGNLLIIHGEADVTTRLEEGQWLYDAAAESGNPALLSIPKAGHTFNSLHPMQMPAPKPVETATKAMASLIADLPDDLLT
jgi:pimeloyl-ACP methyl ester carboxylesterase